MPPRAAGASYAARLFLDTNVLVVAARADPADAHALGEALAGTAALFVTGDAALLELRAIENMEIVSPRGFWEKMKKI